MNNTNSINYGFMKLPKELYTNGEFSVLSSDAKVLFTLILNRTELSYKNKERFTDKNGEVFVYFTVEQICEKLGCGHCKASNLLKTLKENGFIKSVRGGCSKPNRIYILPPYNRFLENGYYSSETQMNSNLNGRCTAVCFSDGNYTNNNNNDMSNTYPSIFYERTVEEIEEQIEIECISGDAEIVRELVLIMADVITMPKDTVKIGGVPYAKSVVADRYRLIRAEHIESIVYDISHSGKKILNMRNFLMAMLFNAPTTLAVSDAAEYAYHTAKIKS